MQRHNLKVVGLGLLVLALSLLLVVPNASAGLEVKAENGETEVQASRFPMEFTIIITLTGSTIEQANKIIYRNDDSPDATGGGSIAGSTIGFFISQEKYDFPATLTYDAEGSYTIIVQVINSTYANGTAKEFPEVIQEATLPIEITKGSDTDGDPINLGGLDTKLLIYILVGAVAVVGVIGGVKVVRGRGGISLPMRLSLPGPPGAPPSVPGMASPLGRAHSANEEGLSGLPKDVAGAKGPVAKRDCPHCRTPIPIPSEKRPLKITCPNPECSKSFTLKAKSGAVSSRPRTLPKTRTRSKASGSKVAARRSRGPPTKRSSVARGRRPSRSPKPALSRRTPAPGAGAPRPKVKGKSPPKPRAPAKGKPPAPKPRPLHCPNDDSELAFYPGASKEYDYADSDYFCPTCELYVIPKEKQAPSKSQPAKAPGPAKTGPAKTVAGPFGASESSAVGGEEANSGGKKRTVTCSNCGVEHELADTLTKNINCTCGRRIRVNR